MSDRKKGMKKAREILSNGEKKPSVSSIMLNCFKYFIPIAIKVKPSYFVLMIINILFNAAKPFTTIFLIPMIITELMGQKRLEIMILIALVTILLDNILSFVISLTDCQMEKSSVLFENYFDEQISLRSMDMDFMLTEDKKALDQIARAKEGMQWYSGGVHGICNSGKQIVFNFITLLGVIAVMAVMAPWLMLVIVGILAISSFLNAKRNKVELEINMQMANINRAFGYILFSLSDFRYGKDIRLYHAENMMMNKTGGQISGLVKLWQNMNRRELPIDEAVVGLGALRDLFTYIYLGAMTITRVITLSEFSMLCSAGGTFNSALNGIVFGLQDLIQRCSYAYEYVKFMEYPAAMKKGTRLMDMSTKHEIEFKNVSFRYPSTDIFVLKNVNLKLHVGEHLSIVGLNGAGKTTFIKLLCRLYDVTEGEILLDGVNIKEYEYDEYVRLFSVVFQDFRLFAFSFDENVTMDDFGTEKASNIDVLFDEVGLSDKLKSLENGKDTMLFKQFDDKGIEPSGGEQQKLAIARALYKNAPVVILDEPTAALDPVAEYEIYRQFDTMIGGKTAIYISHRLSSCKFCDRIAVFSEGTVKEYGTHDELVKLRGGVYSEMFLAQAQYYAEEA